MGKASRLVLAGALTLILLSSACGAVTGSSRTPVGTVLPANQTQAPTVTLASATATAVTVTPLIPITGENVVSMQCQFCVGTETHAVLIFPDFVPTVTMFLSWRRRPNPGKFLLTRQRGASWKNCDKGGERKNICAG